jgi:PLP dependent protein
MVGQLELKANLETVQRRIIEACRRSGRSSSEITLVAVTKSVDTTTIEAVYKLGVRHFGENRVQEADPKIKALASLRPSLTWHMIGHLQSNKVKTALNLFDVIQSLDSLELADRIHQSASPDKPVLLQVNVAGEKTKSGFSMSDIEEMLGSKKIANKVQVKGLMTIAPIVDDPEKVRPIFRRLRQIRDSFGLEQLSMGMTNDFEIAIEEGATMIRIGRAIFGERRPQ